MTISERQDTNEKLLATTDFGYEIIHTFCGEDQCSNEATHAYVSEYQFVMWICESCIAGYQIEVEIEPAQI